MKVNLLRIGRFGPRLAVMAALLAISALLWPLISGNEVRSGPPLVVVISVDGLKPEYVLEGKAGRIETPRLARIFSEGARSTELRPVTPSVTLPNHATMVTGVSPNRHGILNNLRLEPLIGGKAVDFSRAEEIRAPTLWDAARRAGLRTASVGWPLTAGAEIDHNVSARTESWEQALRGDALRARRAEEILDAHRPRLLLCHLKSLDFAQHMSGPFSRRAYSTIESLDAIVGRIADAADRNSGGRAFVVVLSDHGFEHVSAGIRLNAALARAGLLKAGRSGSATEWRAFAWPAGGSAAVYLRDRNDDAVKARAREALRALANDPEKGIDRILEGDEIEETGGFAGAAFVLNARSGYKFVTGAAMPIRIALGSGGSHGYISSPSMNALFMARGPGIDARDLGGLDMRDVAPTLASLLGVRMSEAEGREVMIVSSGSLE